MVSLLAIECDDAKPITETARVSRRGSPPRSGNDGITVVLKVGESLSGLRKSLVHLLFVLAQEHMPCEDAAVLARDGECDELSTR